MVSVSTPRLQQQFLARPAVSTPHQWQTLLGRYLGLCSQVANGATSEHYSEATGKGNAYLSPAYREWHISGVNVRVTLPVCTRECAGVTTSILHLVGW